MLKQWVTLRKTIALLILPYLFLMFLFTFRINYDVLTPGGLSEVEGQIVFDTMYETDGTFYTTYVMNVTRPTFFQFIVSYFDDAMTVTKIPDDVYIPSDQQNFRSGQLASDNAWNQAIITAYTELGFNVEYTIEPTITLIYEDYISNPNLDPLDVVLAINGNDDIEEAAAFAPCDQESIFTVRKPDGSVIDYPVLKYVFLGRCQFGIVIRDYYNLGDVEMPYTVRGSLVGGPSGGFLQFLYIYNVLTEDDITAGLTIAGTGTMRTDGSIGSVGGIKQKVITAHRAGVDIFFVPRINDANPNDNYQIALKTYETLDTDMALVGVSNWLEAITHLESLQAGDLDD